MEGVGKNEGEMLVSNPPYVPHREEKYTTLFFSNFPITTKEVAVAKKF